MGCGHSRENDPQSQALEPHQKALTKEYAPQVFRLAVDAQHISWKTSWPEYDPPSYLHPSVASDPPWADKPSEILSYKFNTTDSNGLNRASFHGKYVLDKDGFPRNPCGRTGLRERGLLGRYGVNHAVDPIVSRWRRLEDGSLVHADDGRPIFEFVAIRRKDTGDWAIPGGFVEPGSNISQTLMKEFSEEALDSLNMSKEDGASLHLRVSKMLGKGHCLYEGYVDDPRNTDNAWIETTVVNYHDSTGKSFGALQLRAGDDAADVKWMEVDDSMVELYASHTKFVTRAKDHRLAEWRKQS
eukprot:m.134737 g.134737  ORF g.134737 m.134737 type:complete len:299 (+) comp23883_c0_seq2:48-944(+)